MFGLSCLSPKAQNRNRRRLAVEEFEDRATPTASIITGNFNGTKIPAGDTVWFSSVGKVSGLGTAPVSLHVTGGTISFTANGNPYTITVPDSTISFSQVVTQATTTYSATDGWLVTAPTSFSGNVFLGGATYAATAGLPGGIKNVKFERDFSADTAGLKVNWQWAAAVYSTFGDLGTFGVKSVDDSSKDTFQNSNHAGTPQSFKNFVVGGATGGGGSNWTGSYSATASVLPSMVPPPPPPPTSPATISGTVFLDAQTADDQPGWHVIDGTDWVYDGITVTLFNSSGSVIETTTTHDGGQYSFGDLAPDTYFVQMVITDTNSNTMYPELGLGASDPGNVDGPQSGFANIILGNGNVATGYNMGIYTSNG